MWALQPSSPATAPTRGGRGAPWIVDLLLALDRQLTHIEHNLSYYFSPNTHLLGEALALYVAGRALPELAASARRATTGRRILLAEDRPADRAPTAATASARRTTTATRSTSTCWRWSSRASPAIRRAARFERRRRRGSPPRRACSPTIAAACPHIGDDDGGVLTADDRPRARRPARQPGHRRRARSIGPICGSAGTRKKRSGCSAAARSWRRRRARQPQRSACRVRRRCPTPATTCRARRRRSPGHRRRAARLPERRPRARRRAVADVLGRAACRCSSIRAPAATRPTRRCATGLRSTALHNTLTLDDRSQSVSRGPFHWSHVANSRVHRWRTNDGFDYFDGAHDGYRPVEHRRRVLALHGDLVVVADFVGRRGDTHRGRGPLAPRSAVDRRTCDGRRADLAQRDRRATHVSASSCPQGVVEPFAGDARHGPRLVFAGLRPGRADDDAARQPRRRARRSGW